MSNFCKSLSYCFLGNFGLVQFELGGVKGKKLLGMQIISGLEIDDDVWEGDDGILDPDNGKLYDCKIWEEDGELQVRGYIGFIYRTQTWVKP